jgi:site-specific DNA-methyltransferase (adenine-specific)
MSAYTLHHGDCLDVMPTLEAGSVDAVICDPPYGTTACKWDSVIPFDPMWEQIRRVLKPRGACVLFGSQPFTSALVMSNVKWFREELIWDKVNRYTGSLNANRRHMKRHENILLFAQASTTYNKQYRLGVPFEARTMKWHGRSTRQGDDLLRVRNGNDGTKHNPCSIIPIKAKTPEQGLHPTQKPLALLEYLVKTYTNAGDTVLDFTFGSGTTGAACGNLGRRFVGIERDAEYFNAASERIATAYAPLRAMQAAAQ